MTLLNDENKCKFESILINLQNTGISTIYIEYSGYGDSGNIDSVFANDHTKTMPEELETLISDFCYELLENEHPGWEINDGASGNFEIDVDEKTISMIHNENYTETNTAHHMWKL